MEQMTLFGRTTKQEEEIDELKEQLEFYEKEDNRLIGIRGILIYSKPNEVVCLGNWDNFEFKFDDKGGLYFDDDFLKKKFLGEWWYCNHIEGWNNNVPAEKEVHIPCEYDDVPDNELMSEHIRNCFISVEREKIKYDKNFAVERLNKAIESYDKSIKELKIKLKI